MKGRVTKLLAGFIVSVMVLAVMGNGSNTAYADEPVVDIADVVAESEDTDIAIEFEDDNVMESGEDALLTEIEESIPALREEPRDESEVYTVDDSDSLGLDVCFYIRTNVEDSLIPDEPSDQPTSYYTSGIRVNQAVSSNSFVYDNNITSNLCDDGYTASNAVRQSLMQVPSVTDIQSIYPSFDPSLQYILWYVIKEAGTPYPNRDVYIHVDGVVLSKDLQEEPIGPVEPENPEEPEDPLNPENPIEPENPEHTDTGRVESDLKFEIYSVNVEPPFEYDGEEHLIGGYIIRVTDEENGDTAEYTYGPYGDFRGVVFQKLRSARASIPGTIIDFMGMAFNINVDSAYLLVKNPESYEIPLFFGGKQISAADIIIRDESGKILDANIQVKTTTVENAVSQRKITITAGSTVQNDNGITVTNENVTISSGSLLPGHRLVTSIVGSQTGPGESVNEITYYDIIGSDGKSYKAMYDVTKENGWLILVKPSDGGGASNDNSPAGAKADTAENVTESVSTALPVILGAKKNNDGTTALLTKTGTTDENAESEHSLSDNKAQVLGARRGDTSDPGIPSEIRLVLIVLCLMALMVINIKRSNS